jgi:5-deoxy-D-glucuronate isomerase
MLAGFVLPFAGLKSKEQHMRELVALAEHREAACKSEIGQLLASRSAMFESSKAAAAVAAAAAAAAAEAAAAAAAGPHSADEDMDAVNARIEAAEKRMDAAQVRLVCDVKQHPIYLNAGPVRTVRSEHATAESAAA